MLTLQRWVWVLSSSFALGALASAGLGACAEQEYAATAFRCDPSAATCPTGYLCCSTDPAALDLANLVAALPDYAGGGGLPVFSGPENDAGQHGRCVDPSAIDGEAVAVFTDVNAAVDGCPLPCNPTWGSADVTAVCGADAFCCQTDEIGPLDCAFDPSLGNAGCWRPVTGQDIDGLGGLNASDWGPSDHDTHQDPRATGCQAFIDGQTVIDPQMAKLACYRLLSVAAQRGLCTAAAGESDPAAVCKLADPEYRDACERMNDEEELTGCD